MKIPRKTMILSLAAAAALLLAAGAVWYNMRLKDRGSVPCAQQPPSQLSPYCLVQSQSAAGHGDRAAMAALAEYFDKRQPAEAVRWTRAAANMGEPKAIGRVFAGCGDAGPFSAAEAQALLPKAPALDALNFRLGGSCADADMAAARAVAPADLLAAPDSAGLCKVALRYGLLRMSREGEKLDSEAAQKLLAECEHRPQVPPIVRKEAEIVRQMLAREIKPVHITVD
ncbi:hypothetical protein GM658_15700 [Pseudoduganella eburnea]|uniref:Sel1 repeat family protein n=1 Tax=Massilia eburnea TaxID=1776165 RepID=A0A6L6QIW4_9BURK|nr:hypothetical protein [Massilia eburnea]MTW12050.1 hypothetical protein [Massilia eburnea]